MFLIEFYKDLYNIVLLCIKNHYICEFYFKCNFSTSILKIELLLNAFTVDFSWATCSQSQSCFNILLKVTFPQANIKMICIFPHALTGSSSWSHELFKTFYSEKLRKLLVNSWFLCWLFQTAQLLLARSLGSHHMLICRQLFTLTKSPKRPW